MINIKQKLNELGAIKVPKVNYNYPDLPSIVISIIKNYEHSVIFDNMIGFSPKYKTNFETKDGYLFLEVLWGLEQGHSNIEDANNSLKELGGDEQLYAIGGEAGSNLICISVDNGAIYLFTNGILTEKFKLFDSIEEFFESLVILDDDDDDDDDLISIELNF